MCRRFNSAPAHLKAAGWIASGSALAITAATVSVKRCYPFEVLKLGFRAKRCIDGRLSRGVEIRSMDMSAELFQSIVQSVRADAPMTDANEKRGAPRASLSGKVSIVPPGEFEPVEVVLRA